MAATGRNMNWTNVSIASTALTGVSSMAWDYGAELLTGAFDNDIFDTIIVQNAGHPSVTITTANVPVATGLGLNTPVTVVGTLKDAKAATGGNVTFSGTNGYLQGPSFNDTHGQFAQSSLTYKFQSSDGQTNPISFALA